MPDEEPIVATVGLVLVHVPPEVPSISVLQEPRHTLPAAKGTGAEFTVTTAVRVQPVPGCVYVIVSIPGIPPVVIPLAKVTDAIDVLLLIHVPPPGGSVSEVDCPEHTCNVPTITPGGGYTCIGEVIKQPVGAV